MQIDRFPILETNYTFMLSQGAIAAVVDPALASPVLAWLEQHQLELVAIFNTHHHHDHVGGNLALLERYPQAVVYGGAQDQGRIPGLQVALNEGDRVEFGDRTAEVWFLPGHTLGHIAYYFPPVLDSASLACRDNRSVPPQASRVNGAATLPESEPFPEKKAGDLLSRDLFSGDLFCGDVLFGAGCGRLKEGTPAQAVAAMERLRSLPDNTRIWCAHEYTLDNLRFALTVDPDNRQLQQRMSRVQALRDRHQPTVPLDLGEEKLTNPFLRWDATALQASTNTQDPVRCFARLRGRKDLFRG